MVDEQEGCEWMTVSSGTFSAGQTRTKGRKTVVCVCVCVCVIVEVAVSRNFSVVANDYTIEVYSVFVCVLEMRT